MQGRVFFLVVDLQTGLRATPVQLVFNLIIQNKTSETVKGSLRISTRGTVLTANV
jgi:hypothetical protein